MLSHRSLRRGALAVVLLSSLALAHPLSRRPRRTVPSAGRPPACTRPLRHPVGADERVVGGGRERRPIRTDTPARARPGSLAGGAQRSGRWARHFLCHEKSLWGNSSMLEAEECRGSIPREARSRRWSASCRKSSGASCGMRSPAPRAGRPSSRCSIPRGRRVPSSAASSPGASPSGATGRPSTPSCAGSSRGSASPSASRPRRRRSSPSCCATRPIAAP